MIMAGRDTRSQRLTFLVTPEEKQAISAKAAELGTTSSEVVRLAFDHFALQTRFSPEEERRLEAVAAELTAAVAQTRDKLDQAIADTRAALAELRAERELRSAA